MNSNYYRDPDTDFSRSSKLSFTTVLNSILFMGGNSLGHEMLELINYTYSTPTSSVFVQARDKILPTAILNVFYGFTKTLAAIKFRGYKLLAVDGTNLNIFGNPNDIERFNHQGSKKGYNNLILSYICDLLNKLYSNLVIKPFNKTNEKGALIDMLPNINCESIVIADRGYESYNVFAHFEEVNTKYVIRVKDINSNGILSVFNFPK